MLGAQKSERTQSLVMEAESLVWPYVRLFAYIPSQRFIDLFDTLQAISTLCTTLSYFLLSFLIIWHSPPRKRAMGLSVLPHSDRSSKNFLENDTLNFNNDYKFSAAASPQPPLGS